jgi:hypothetical protein
VKVAAVPAPFAAPGALLPAIVVTTRTVVTAATAAAIAATAAAIATTAAAIATAAGSAATAAAAAAGLSLIDAEGAPHQLGTLQAVDGLGFQFGIGHLHEGETTLATRIPLEGKGTVDHFAIGGEEFDHVFLLSAEGKIADEDAHGTSRGDRRAQMRQ